MAEVPGILTIGFVEEILEKTTKRKFQYSDPQTAQRRAGRQPGSNLPLPSGVPLPSIYNLNLPIPGPSDLRAQPARTRRAPAADRPPLETPGTEATPQLRPALQPAAPETERIPRPIRESPPGSARPETPFPRRSLPEAEEQPPVRDERQPFRTPGSTRPDTSLPRRSPPAAEDQPPVRDERQPFRTPGSTRPDTSLPRRSSPAAEDQPPTDRLARPQPGSLPPRRREEDEDQTPGPLRRPASPFDRRPSPFEDDEDDEDIIYEDFDDENGVLDNVYDDDE
jgi:hypothetical protein